MFNLKVYLSKIILSNVKDKSCQCIKQKSLYKPRVIFQDENAIFKARDIHNF